MAQYYNTQPIAIPIQGGTGTQDASDDKASILSEFDKHCKTLLTTNSVEEGWASELCRYTSTMQQDVTKNTDLVEWWQVRNCLEIFLVTHHHYLEQCNLISYTCTDHPRCPPSQASSVPCKQMFSGSKQIAIDCWACLGSTVFEELVIMGLAWRPKLYDMAAWSAFQVEEVDTSLDFEEMLENDDACLAWEKDLDMETVE